MLSSLLRVAPILNHGHDEGNSQKHTHNGASNALRLVELSLCAICALALPTATDGRPRVLLAYDICKQSVMLLPMGTNDNEGWSGNHDINDNRDGRCHAIMGMFA